VIRRKLRAAVLSAILCCCATPSLAQLDPQRIIEQFVRPGGIIDNLARPPITGAPPRLSDRPSISCNRALSPVGQILCLDRQGAGADWDLNATLWAVDGSLDDSQKKAFGAEQQSWRSSLDARCGLLGGAGAFSGQQRNCVIKAFHDRAASLRTRLSGDALEESKLSPEDHAQIQQALVARNFLADRPDGEFGNNTRQAVRSYQINEKAKPTGVLSGEQRDRLLADSRPSLVQPGVSASGPPNAGDGNSRPDAPAAGTSTNPLIPDQAGPPFVLQVYGQRQMGFAIGRIASADEICAQLGHPVFSHNQSDYFSNNSPMSLDPQNLGLKWVADRLISAGQGRTNTVELNEATKLATDENLKTCLRSIATGADNRIANISRLLLSNLNPRCYVPGAEMRTESYLGPSGEMFQRQVPGAPQQSRCASWSLIQTSSVFRPNGYLMLLTLAEANPALQTLMNNAEEAIQAGIAARLLEQKRQEEQRRADEEASQKAADARREAEAKAERQRADQIAEQKRLAEEKLAGMRAVAQTMGIEYANKRETVWSLSSRTDEMSDKIALEAFSIQKTPNGVIANVKVRCFDKKFSVTALIVDGDGKPTIELPTVEFLGASLVRGQLRFNDDNPTDVFLRPAGNFRNELAISPSLPASITDGTAWRLYVSIPTNIEPIIVKIPWLDQQLQKVVKSCS
jgi:peptidoglycan hydrolase-like protein with peptidoglycan-binding domain